MKPHSDPHWNYLESEDVVQPGDIFAEKASAYAETPIWVGTGAWFWCVSLVGSRVGTANVYRVYARRNPYSYERIEWDKHANEVIADHWEAFLYSPLTSSKREIQPGIDRLGHPGSWVSISDSWKGSIGDRLSHCIEILPWVYRGWLRRPIPGYIRCCSNPIICPKCPKEPQW